MMRLRSLSGWFGLLALSALAWSPGAGSVGEAEGPGAEGTGFRGVTIQTGRCQTLSRVGVTAWRNTSERVDICVPHLGPCGVHTIGGGGAPNPDIDALYVEMCIDAETKLAGRYPDSVQRVGSQRIVAAQVALDAGGRGGDLTVTFYGGGRVRVPLDVRRSAACAKPCPPTPSSLGAARLGPTGVVEAPAGKMPVGKEAASADHGKRKPHGPFGLHRFRVRNTHPTKRVRKATAHAADEKTANAPVGPTPLVVRNVAPANGDLDNPVEGEEYARVVHVTVCMEGGETLQARVTADDEGQASRFEFVEITVGEDFAGNTTLEVSDAVLHDLSDYTVAHENYGEVTCTKALETVQVTNQRAAPVTVRVLAGTLNVPLDGGNPFQTPGGQTRARYTITDVEHQTLTIRVCTGVTNKNLNFPLDAGANAKIRTVNVQVAANGDTTVTAESWAGAAIAAGTPSPANPCPGP